MHKIISDYLDQVCAPIRRQTLRKCAREELAAHLLERCAELEQEGFGCDAAARSAVSRMGDPAGLGRRIVKANRSRRDTAAVIAGSGLAVLGLLFTMILSSGVASFVNTPSFLMCLILAAAFALLSAGRGLTLQKFLHQFKYGAIFGGVLIAVISVIAILRSLDDPGILGVSVSVALLSVFYGLLFGAIAHAMERWCEPPGVGSVAALLED